MTDHRTRVKPSQVLKAFEESVGHDLPKKKIVCPTCRGTGKHVNPNIDSNGITASEMYELGDDFREDYMAGAYDVTCYECKGHNVVDVVDHEWLSIHDPELLKEFSEYLREERDYQAMCESERRMGA